MGGWKSKGRGAAGIYDHGLEAESYLRDQKKVAKWLGDQGYLG